MSNPAICYLARTELNGISFRVEDNLGEAVHIHYADIRINMTISEFMKFSDCVIKAVQELFNLRKLDWKMFDIESLKEEWASNYMHITSAYYSEVMLDSLYMKESYVKKRSIKRMIPVKESGYINFLNDCSDDSSYYNDPGVFEPSRGEKARYIEKKINELGYPYNDGRILIDNEGYILDGLKRASCLYNKYGGNYLVPVTIINIKWKEDLKTRILKAENAIYDFEQKHSEEKEHQNCFGHDDNKEIKYKEVIDLLNDIRAEYMIINDIESEVFGAYSFILINEKYYEKIREKGRNLLWGNNNLAEMAFAYYMKKPLLFYTNKGLVILHDKYFVKSKFVKNTYVPLDKKIQNWIWENRFYDNSQEMWMINEFGKTILNVIQSVLNGKMIPLLCIEKVEENKEFFYEEKSVNLLKSVFFEYTAHLLDCLLGKKYVAAVEDYVSFSEY